MTDRVLLRGGCVLTLDTRLKNFTEADVLIEGSRIAEVGPRLTARDALMVDASNAIVMPGFVDAHRHAWKSLLRNLGHAGPGAGHLTPDDLYAGTLVGLLGAIEAGITTVVDWADVPVGDHSRAVLQAHTDAGLRTVLVRPAVGSVEHPPEPHRSGPLTTLARGMPEPKVDDLDGMADRWKVARDEGVPIHAHAGMSPDAAGAIAHLGERGLLDDRVTLIHCTNLGVEDLDAIATSGAAVTLTPSTEMTSGPGAPPIQPLLDRGIRPALGVDDERTAPGDMFAQMRATISLQHATMFDLKLAGKAGLPTLLTTRDVIRSATLDGARAAGLSEAIGTLTPGKQADVVVLRTDRPNVFPINDPIGAVVWGMDTSNLDWVFVAGQVLMREGALTADADRARSLAAAARPGAASAARMPSSGRASP